MVSIRQNSMNGFDSTELQRLKRANLSFYRGICTDTKDPKQIGRIKVKVPNLMKDVELEWLDPMLPYGGYGDVGTFFIPEVDGLVWVAFENGDINRGFYMGSWWACPDDISEAPAEGKKQENTIGTKSTATGADLESPTNKVIKTKSGHTFEMDDTPGQEKIRIRNGAAVIIIRTGPPDKIRIEINDAAGQFLLLDTAAGLVEIRDVTGNDIRMDSGGITLFSPAAININAVGSVNITGSSVNLN